MAADVLASRAAIERRLGALEDELRAAAGPPADLGTLVAAHEALGRVPGVLAVGLREYADGVALLELRLA